MNKLDRILNDPKALADVQKLLDEISPGSPLLKFGQGNSKLAPNIFTFSLPAGYACPGSFHCRSQAVKTNKGFRIKDGPACQFRCFAAIDEVLKPNVRLQRWHNFNLLKGKSRAEMESLIRNSMPKPNWKFMVRLHVSGDFFSQDYFDAWLNVAKSMPKTVFYTYTKSLPFWLARRSVMPKNFRLVASRGGKWDALIEKHGLRSVRVVFSEAEAAKLGLKIDHDDSLAYQGRKDFLVLIHGTQPAGSPAAAAWQALKKIGKGGYGNQRKGRSWNSKDSVGVPIKKNRGGGTPAPMGMLVFA